MSGFCGATVWTVYLPLVVSLVVKIVPSIPRESSASHGVASTVMLIGELASTVFAGDIIIPYVALDVTIRENLISGDVVLAVVPSMRDAVRILFS